MLWVTWGNSDFTPGGLQVALLAVIGLTPLLLRMRAAFGWRIVLVLELWLLLGVATETRLGHYVGPLGLLLALCALTTSVAVRHPRNLSSV